MFLNTIVIVLRETLEAGVLISLMLAIGQRYRMSPYWLLIAVIVGILGAVVYAMNLGRISDWFDYVGQEVTNASLQYLIYASLVMIGLLHRGDAEVEKGKLALLMAIVVGLAFTREGGELVIFYSGLFQSGAGNIQLTSGFIGLLIGMSVGSLFFYGLVTLSAARALIAEHAVLCLVAGGMVLQATQLLIQADWLPSLEPLWNSNGLLDESSIGGQLVYAIFGYEATPSVLEATVYICAVGLIPALKIGMYVFANRKRPMQLDS